MVTAGEKQRGAGVPEVVEPDIRQFCAPEQRLEGGCGNVAEVKRSAGCGAEDEVIILLQIPKLEPSGVLCRLVLIYAGFRTLVNILECHTHNTSQRGI